MYMSDVTGDTPELADYYDRVSDAQFWMGRLLIEKMGVKKGDVLLDVGCGTGRLALAVSEKLGPKGSIIGVDPSPHRINIAQEKLSKGCFPNVNFMVGAAEDLGLFPEGTFEGVYYSSVFHWIQEKERALNEAYRVLKPGGRIGITTPDPSGIFKFLHTTIRKIVVKPPYSQHIKRPSSGSVLITKETLSSLFERTKFVNLEIEIIERKAVYSSASSLMSFYTASSFGNFLSFMPENIREALKQDIIKELDKKMTEEGLELISKTIRAIAEKST